MPSESSKAFLTMVERHGINVGQAAVIRHLVEYIYEKQELCQSPFCMHHIIHTPDVFDHIVNNYPISREQIVAWGQGVVNES